MPTSDLTRRKDNYPFIFRNLPHDGRTARFAQKSLPGDKEKQMLWTITIVLVILWALGLVSGYTLGGWVHILLVLAVIVLIFNLLSGRRTI